jgi:hypothetical protein
MPPEFSSLVPVTCLLSVAYVECPWNRNCSTKLLLGAMLRAPLVLCLSLAAPGNREARRRSVVNARVAGAKS